MRKVIFIGGTAYSGSTFLDMMLSNSPKGFSCGEVHALFYPYRKHHIDYKCGCGDTSCELWRIVKQRGVKCLYQTIFEMHPEIEFIVDSSKDSLWIRDRTADLKGTGIEIKNILIWKAPDEYFSSRIKRKKIQRSERTWLNYHKIYFANVKHWRAIRYADLARSAEVLKLLCEKLEIPYFSGKEKYWEKTHHTLFGNTSAKIHLYNSESNEFKRCANELDTTIQKFESKDKEHKPYKEIYYDSPELVKKYEMTTRKPQEIGYIQAILEAADISNPAYSWEDIELKVKGIHPPKGYKVYFRLKYLYLNFQTRFLKRISR